MINALNFAAFQCGWFACVLGAAHGHPWLGVAAVAAVATLHVASANRPGTELTLLLLGAALGAIGGPLAYLGGARLGALALANETAAMAVQAIGWALLTPVLLRLAQRYDGFLSRTPDRSAMAARHA